MDYALLIEIFGGGILSGFCGIVGYSMKRNIRQIDESLKEHQGELREAQIEITKRKDELADFKLHVAQNHVTQSDLSKSIDRIDLSIERLVVAVNDSAKEMREQLNMLNVKIDGKADK
jgi:chromosome segregation ATPase